jgi:TPP-dependent 2-oxoacid decarboxylase
VGDGSFQAQELSTILRHDHKPVIFRINNGGYTIERGYLDKSNWSYADPPKVFRRDTRARSFVCSRRYLPHAAPQLGGDRFLTSSIEHVIA